MNSMKLPDELEQAQIANMRVGESAWTVPWAMYAEPNGDLYINGKYTPLNEPGGTVTMRITKTYDGIVADISGVPSELKVWPREGCHHVGGSTPIPVFDLVM